MNYDTLKIEHHGAAAWMPASPAEKA